MITCRTCGNAVNYDDAPFPVVAHDRANADPLWYCSQKCMAVEWPDALPPLEVGNVVSCDYLAYEEPRIALNADAEIFTANPPEFTHVDKRHTPCETWAVIDMRDDKVFAVPWVSDLQDVEDGALVHQVYARYQTTLSQSDTPIKSWLILDRGQWRKVKDIQLASRFYQVSPESVESAKQKYAA